MLITIIYFCNIYLTKDNFIISLNKDVIYIITLYKYINNLIISFLKLNNVIYYMCAISR